MEIGELESKLAKMGRSVRCIDSRNRPGHPPDYVCHFESGAEAMTCAYSYEAALAWAVLLVEPECPTQRAADEGDSQPPIYVFSVRDLSTKKADTKPALHR